jgi:hypothetical protein
MKCNSFHRSLLLFHLARSLGPMTKRKPERVSCSFRQPTWGPLLFQFRSFCVSAPQPTAASCCFPKYIATTRRKYPKNNCWRHATFFFLSLFLYLWPTDVAQGVRLMLQGVAGRLFPLDSITGDFATGDRRWYLAGPHSLASSSAALNITRAQGRIRTRSRKYYGVW